MFQKQQFKYAAAFLIGSLSWASVSAYIAPTTAVVPAPVNAPAAAPDVVLTPWSAFLSEEAVDSAGIEADLDGNASALAVN